MIRSMSIREIQSRYIGTLGGVAWSVIQPLMTILVYWFVFSVGFKVKPAGNKPFIVVFLCGMIPWMMFNEVIFSSANAILANPHLVKKTVFPTEILPFIYLFASLITHSIVLIIFIVVMVLNKMPFSLYNLQFLYYLFALSIFSLGLGWFLSAINVFVKDTLQILSVVVNMWFWLTPIVWNLEMLPVKYRYIVKLNPFYYIVEGYKSSFVYNLPFWHNWRLGLYFWFFCLAVLVIGASTFRKLKQEFAEIL
jgi:ABC-type polysaccharide/polyol phosphate export permease